MHSGRMRLCSLDSNRSFPRRCNAIFRVKFLRTTHWSIIIQNQFIPHYTLIVWRVRLQCIYNISSMYVILLSILIRPTVMDCIWISFLRCISSFLTPLKLNGFALKFDFILHGNFGERTRYPREWNKKKPVLNTQMK